MGLHNWMVTAHDAAWKRCVYTCMRCFGTKTSEGGKPDQEGCSVGRTSTTRTSSTRRRTTRRKGR